MKKEDGVIVELEDKLTGCTYVERGESVEDCILQFMSMFFGNRPYRILRQSNISKNESTPSSTTLTPISSFEEYSQQLKEKSKGHKDIWKCSLNEFIDKVFDEFKVQIAKGQTSEKVYKLAMQFMRIKFDQGELEGTVEYEVTNSIREAAIYYINVAGESI